MSTEIIVRNKSRKSFGEMFPNKLVKLDEDVLSLQSIASAEDIDAEISKLPEELVLYFHSMVLNFPKHITDLTSNLIELIEERETANLLWNYFGEPQIPEAVPVFQMLSEDLVFAGDDVQDKSLEAEAFLYKVEKAIQKVFLFYVSQQSRLEAEKNKYTIAVERLAETEMDGATMENAVASSRIAFVRKNQEIDEELNQIRDSYGAWSKYVSELKKKMPILRFFETPIDIGAPDPAMAL